jgi:hypothetical protein
MRGWALLIALSLPTSAAAQEIRITGPLAGAGSDPGPPHRNFAAGGHITDRGGGAILRARPWRQFAFDVLGDYRVDRTLPLVARIGTLIPVSRNHELFFSLGPTWVARRGRDSVGAEASIGVESFVGRWWILRAELAGSMVERQDPAITLRIGVLNVFGSRASPGWE